MSENQKVTLKLVKKSDLNNTSNCEIIWTTTPYTLTFSSEIFGELHVTGNDIFDCLINLRKIIEPQGYLIACNGSRVDAYPSGMSRSMSGGYLVYVAKIGESAKRENLVQIFDEAPIDKIGTVEEQKAYHQKWAESF